LIPFILKGIDEVVNNARKQVSLGQVEQGVEHIDPVIIKLQELVGIFFGNLTPKIEIRID
jgi:hypothetical protein